MAEKPPKSATQKLIENVRALRSQKAPRERIQEEIDYWSAKIDAETEAERKLSPLETVAALGSKAAGGATFETFDEGAALLGSDTETQRILQRQVEKDHPVLSAAVSITGAVANPIRFVRAAPKVAGLNAFGRAAPVVLEGAAQGAAAGLGAGEGDLVDRLESAAAGGTAGAVVTGALGGAGKVLGGAGRKLGERLGLRAPTLDELAERTTDSDLTAARLKLDRLKERRLADEALTADLLPQGEGALRQAATTNRTVRSEVDETLRSRANRLANRADDRFSEYTETQPSSARKSIQELDEEASVRARPFYKAAEEEAALADAASPRVRASAIRDMPIRDKFGRLQRNLESVSDDELQREYARLAELNSAEEGLHAGVEDAAYRGDYYELPRTERLGKKGQEDLPDADGMVDAEVLAADNKIVSDFRRSQIVRQARTAAMERIDRELARRPGATDFDFGANAAPRGAPKAERLTRENRAELAAMGVKPPAGDAIDEALSLPYVQTRITELKRAPRSRFANASEDDHALLDQVYKDIGRQIRSLDRKDWSLKEDLISQRAILADAITGRAPSYRKALDEFADPMGRKDAFQLGNTREPADVIPGSMAGLDKAEAASFREGKAALLRQDVPNLDIGELARFQDVLAPIASREKAQVFRATFGEQAYKEYVADLLEMAGLQRMKGGAGESTTVDKFMEQIQAEPEAIVGVVRSLLAGNPIGAITQSVPLKALERLRSSKQGAKNAEFLLRRGDDAGRAIEELQTLRRAARQPSTRTRPFSDPKAPFLADAGPSAERALARLLGASVGRP